MKKTLFFMIFIFATAVCGYAQETPAAEQNDDSELISRYQNRRTTPFVCGRYGYGFGKIHGSYDSLVLGMRLALKNNHSLTAGVEYSVQLDIGDNDYSQTNIGFRLGYEF